MNNFFLHDGKNHIGPFSIEDLKYRKITKDDLIWHEGLSSWTKAVDIQELKHLFILTPPPLTPPTLKKTLPDKPNLPKFETQLNLEDIKTNPKKASEIMALFLATDYGTSGKLLFGNLKIREWKELDNYISNVKQERRFEIENSKGIMKHLDETIALLCINDQREQAKSFHSKITKQDFIKSSSYVDNLILRHNLDMSKEKIRKKLSLKKEENRIPKRIIATLILAFVTYEIFQVKQAISVFDDLGYEGTLFKYLFEGMSNLLGQPNILSEKASTFITLLLFSYIVKTILSIILTLKNDSYLWINSELISAEDIFMWLIVAECVCFGLIFSFSPFGDYFVSILYFAIPSAIISGLHYD